MTTAPDLRSVVALFCTRGMETFLSNAIQGILQAGIDPSQIHVGCSNNARRLVKSVTQLQSDQIQIVSTQKLSENEAALEKYASFGSRSFTDISWKKIFFIRELIELHPHVIYADLDISWIRNPLPYLAQVASVYPIAIQTEGLPRFPPAMCCGFASFARSERTIAFLDALIAFDSAQAGSDDRLDDQAACQRLIENDVTWLHDIYCLPEALFLNGLGYRNLQNAGASPSRMEAELQPFLFHANWTVGIDNKRKLLGCTGTWLLGDTPQIDQTTTAQGSSTEIGFDSEARAETSPLLTVIYPVFDVRADTLERIRLWTEAQDLDPRKYRVFVVAGTATELDAALRKILRSQDAILRVPGTGREADYWNAGAREAGTPWLLFVEGHGMPARDSLSALAAWIATNPKCEACNFPIKNLESHRVARLMKRWFAETQTGWTDPATWRRLHRTACAIRRDVFEDFGPFELQYGQFAPPLLSARLHQRGLTISALPASGIVHDDSLEISVHHDDTADYVRGEMEARAENDPVFFEKYFGPSPGQGPDMILPARDARSMIRGLVAAALHRPGETFDLLKQACALLPDAFISLRDRARLLTALTRADEFSVMYLPLAEEMRWKRFLLAHHRVVRTEQVLWMARNPLTTLKVGSEKRRWPIDTISRYAAIGMHALEQRGDDAFRWTHPVFLLRLAFPSSGVLTLETRNLRPRISLSDIIIVVGGKPLSSDNLRIDETGNLKLRIQSPFAPENETDIVVIARELCEPASENGPGRRLGLPLFSVGFECDHPQDILPTRP